MRQSWVYNSLKERNLTTSKMVQKPRTKNEVYKF